MKKHTYFVTQHPELTRTTSRTYTHCVVMHITAESEIASLESQKAGYMNLERRNYEYMQQEAKSVRYFHGMTREQAQAKAVQALENAGTLEEYLEKCWNEKMEIATNTQTYVTAVTWCGSLGLAMKQAGYLKGKRPHHKIEVKEVTQK